MKYAISTQILAILLLISSLTIPMFCIDGGIFPSEYAWSLEDTLNVLEYERMEALDYYAVRLHVCAWIFGMILCMGALFRNRIVATASSFVGAVSMLMVIKRNVDSSGISLKNLINADNGNYCIGYWIVLFLFLLCGILSIPKEDDVDGQEEEAE